MIVEGIVSSSRRPECQETCQESVVGAQRGSWTSEGASKGLLGRREPGRKGVLGSKGPARRASKTQVACRESVLGSRGLAGRASWTPEACREGVLGPRGLPGGRLGPQRPAGRGVWGPKWPAGRASWAPGGLPGGRLGPQRPARRASWAPEACRQGLQGRKVTDPRNCQRFQGSAQAALCPRTPRTHSRPTEICLELYLHPGNCR